MPSHWIASSPGLLRDLGKRVLAHSVPGQFWRVAPTSRARGTALPLETRAALGTDHPVAGAMLLEKWRIAPAIVDTAPTSIGPTRRIREQPPVSSRPARSTKSSSRALAASCWYPNCRPLRPVALVMWLDRVILFTSDLAPLFEEAELFSKIGRHCMKIRFWGVRGSIASPGPKTVRYGGNTTCIEIRTDAEELIIIDAGTGIFPLSQTLLNQLPLTANVLITHSHWDHIQGLPFFVPNFIPGNVLRLHGAFDPVSGNGIEQVMSVQLQYSYFPVREAELKARMEYVTLTPGQEFRIGTATVTPFLLNHPVINFGYRIESAGKSVFFTGDHEPPYNIYAPADEEHAEYQQFVDEKANAISDAMRGVDVLIADSSYTANEYAAKQGWGHGTFGSSFAYARQARARVLFCTHHEPTRSDDALELAFGEELLASPSQPGDPEIRLACEGETFEF